MTESNDPGGPPNYGQQNFGQQPFPQGQPYSGQYPGYGVQQPKKRKKWPWVLLAIVVLILALAGGCVALIGGAADSINDESNRVVSVTYEITGEGTGTATYTTGNLDTAQDTDIALPWSKTVEITGLGKSVSLLASNSFDSAGTIKCVIRQGDKVISENSASGPGASTSCSGQAE